MRPSTACPRVCVPVYVLAWHAQQALQIAVGWPRQVTVVASREGCSGCAISGSALTGVFCDQSFQLCLTVTDCFSNSRSAPGHFAAVSRLDPEQVYELSMTVTQT